MVSINSMSFGYKKRQPVLEGLSLDFRAGGVYGILGANGVGKTTLLHLICGLLFPQSGRLEVAGSIPARRLAGFLERVFYVPVAFDLPALRIAAYGACYAPFYPKFDRAAWTDALQVFELHEQDRINNLSFGQKKKVLLSFALASGCDLLLFDEPTDGLDIPSKDGFRRLLSRQIDAERLALITTHHVQDVAMLLDHLVILRERRLLLDAPLGELTTRFRTIVAAQEPAAAQLLYAERVPGGHHCLVRNTDGQEGPLDLELLFKALQIHPEIAA